MSQRDIRDRSQPQYDDDDQLYRPPQNRTQPVGPPVVGPSAGQGALPPPRNPYLRGNGPLPGPNNPLSLYNPESDQAKRVRDAYLQYTGREPGEEDYATHVGNPGGVNGVLDTIINSDEARAYASRPPVAPPAGAPAGAPAGPAPAGQGQRAGGQYFTGFDLGKQYSADSAKGAFLNSITDEEAADPRWRDKATAADWFNEFVRPDMEAAGFRIGDVQGDRAFVHTSENPEGTWIDFIRGVQGDDDVLQWLDESYMDDPGGGAIDGPGGGPLAARNLANLPGGSDLLEALMGGDGLQSSDLMRQIQAELQQLLTGGAPSTPNVPLPRAR